MCAELDPLSHFKRLLMEIFGFSQKETGAESVVSRCHYVYFVMYISCAKFEEHGSNISGNILDRVLYCFSGTTYGRHFPRLHYTKT